MSLKTLFLLLLFVSLTSVANAKQEIHLISVSSSYDPKQLKQAIQKLEASGYIFNTKYVRQEQSDLGYTEDDSVRAHTLIEALTDPNVKMLWFIRGGAGAFNLLPFLEQAKERIKKTSPKLLIGFSDVTAIHYYMNTQFGWPTIHGIVALYNANTSDNPSRNELNSENSLQEIIDSLSHGINYDHILKLNTTQAIEISGPLYGGNLTLIQSFFSTKYEQQWNNKVLLLEDVNVTYRQLDRTLHQLLYKTNFHPKAIVFGQFYPSNASDSERLIYKETIREFAQKTKIPVFYYPVFGHGTRNQPFLLARSANITCIQEDTYCHLTQSALLPQNN